MKNFPCIVLVILVFSTSLNKGQKIKINERRAAGLVPYPRIGRHLGMASYARTDGAAGLVNFPRVGRSGSVTSVDINSPREFDSEPRLERDRNIDLEMGDDFDYPGPHHEEYEESKKRFEALTNSGMWLGGQPNPGQIMRKDHHRVHRCNQQIDGPWAVLFAARDFPGLNQQPVHNFGPSQTRDGVEHDAVAANNMAI